MKNIIHTLTPSALVLAAAFVLVSPILASAQATDQGDTTVTATIDPTISMTTGGTVGVSLAPTTSATLSSASDTVTVATNSENGYNLKLSSSDTTNAMSGPGGDSITAHNGTFSTPTALGTNTWGYRIVGAGGFTSTAYSAELDATASTSTWAGIPVSSAPQTVKTTAVKSASSTTTVWYGVKVDASISSGAYSDTVTYTATTNL
ncbi:MAG: exported protein of unknown function [Candidatus Saccharibacteria bacterium]|nr:exported protein of unknown function [Candidatus Saccharibacteria bacterium]